MRTDKYGNAMKANEVLLQRNGKGWDDPKVTIHSECFFPDGTAYAPSGIEPDRILVSYAVAKGIWTREEALQVKELITKLYEGLGESHE